MPGIHDPVTIGPLTMQWVKVYFPKANGQVAVQHRCRGQFLEFGVADVDKHCSIKRGAMPPASNVVHLVSDTDGVTATIRVVTMNIAGR